MLTKEKFIQAMADYLKSEYRFEENYENEAYDICKEQLSYMMESEACEYGDHDFDWSEDGAKEEVDIMVSYWDD